MAASFPLYSEADWPDAEVIYLDDGTYDDADAVERTTSPLALAIFGAGLVLAVLLVMSAPALAGLSLVGGIVIGGIVNAPAGAERRQTIAALGVPSLGLLVITAMFISSF